jgi:hypothetical protein
LISIPEGQGCIAIYAGELDVSKPHLYFPKSARSDGIDEVTFVVKPDDSKSWYLTVSGSDRESFCGVVAFGSTRTVAVINYFGNVVSGFVDEPESFFDVKTVGCRFLDLMCKESTVVAVGYVNVVSINCDLSVKYVSQNLSSILSISKKSDEEIEIETDDPLAKSDCITYFVCNNAAA